MRPLRWLTGSVLLLFGCATTPPHPAPVPHPVPVEKAAVAEKRLIIYAPVSDAEADVWLAYLEGHPTARMVLALSPRFPRFLKEKGLGDRIRILVREKRVGLALQIPNPPILPLLINTDSARNAIPVGAALPQPAFAFPEDAIQILVGAKNQFFRTYKVVPSGVISPQGAVSPESLKSIAQAGLQWTVGAMGFPGQAAPYNAGSAMLFDASPAHVGDFEVMIFDERALPDPGRLWSRVTAAIQSVETAQGRMLLPDDFAGQGGELPSPWPPGRTWRQKDWSGWIGTSEKNQAWHWIEQTRQDLESFKNSGDASVRKLDGAFPEMYSAESSNYLYGIGRSAGAGPDLGLELRASLSNVYRLIGRTPPDAWGPEVTRSTATASNAATRSASSGFSVVTEASDARITITDPVGDATVPANFTAGPYDLTRFELTVSSLTLDFRVVVASAASSAAPPPLIDIYMDLNGAENAGTTALLTGRGLSAAAADAWEYALVFHSGSAELFRTRGADSFELVSTFPCYTHGNEWTATVPRNLLRGTPVHWHYQVLVMAQDIQAGIDPARPLIPDKGKVRSPIYDLLDSPDLPQGQFWDEVKAGVRTEIPFIRIKRTAL